MCIRDRRRADDRCAAFKQEIAQLQKLNSDLENDIFLLNEKVSLRDQEITRLQVVSTNQGSYNGIRQNFDQKSAEDKIISQERQLDFINRQNQELLAEMKVKPAPAPKPHVYALYSAPAFGADVRALVTAFRAHPAPQDDAAD